MNLDIAHVICAHLSCYDILRWSQVSHDIYDLLCHVKFEQACQIKYETNDLNLKYYASISRLKYVLVKHQKYFNYLPYLIECTRLHILFDQDRCCDRIYALPSSVIILDVNSYFNRHPYTIKGNVQLQCLKINIFANERIVCANADQFNMTSKKDQGNLCKYHVDIPFSVHTLKLRATQAIFKNELSNITILHIKSVMDVNLSNLIHLKRIYLHMANFNETIWPDSLTYMKIKNGGFYDTDNLPMTLKTLVANSTYFRTNAKHMEFYRLIHLRTLKLKGTYYNLTCLPPHLERLMIGKLKGNLPSLPNSLKTLCIDDYKQSCLTWPDTLIHLRINHHQII